MTIANEITKLNTNLSASYTACNNKGATMPANQNFDNLATCIGSIQTGGGSTLITKTITANGTYNASSDNADGYSSVTVNVPNPSTGTLSITQNGTYDVTNYASANVSVSGGGGGTESIDIPREVKDGVYQIPTEITSFTLPSNATDLDDYELNYAFYNATSLTTVDLSSLTTISGEGCLNNAFWWCPSITNINLSNLTTVSGDEAMYDTFGACTSLTSIDLSNLEEVSGEGAMSSTFERCTSLTTVDLSSLTTVSGAGAMSNIFNDCTSLTSIDLSNLEEVSGEGAMVEAFTDCTNLSSLSFPSLTTISEEDYAFMDMLSGVDGCIVHFPAELEEMEWWDTVQNGFGGTNTVVLFDL